MRRKMRLLFQISRMVCAWRLLIVQTSRSDGIVFRFLEGSDGWAVVVGGSGSVF